MNFSLKTRLGMSLASIAALTMGLSACTSPQAATNAPTGGGSGTATSGNSAPAGGGSSASINGAGSTAANPIYQRWFQDYNKQNPGVQISYDSVGSGAGVQRFLQQVVDFAGTDDPIKAEERAKIPADRGGAVQIPSTGIFVVLAYNLQGVDNLKLSREAYCGIADGSIKTWNDPKIAKDNAGVNLPNSPVTFVHRSDGSGTTAIFTRHLAKACPNWKGGSGKTVEWPVGTGAKGSDGVAAQVQQTAGGIGYVEYSYASQNKLKSATLQNKAGDFIAASPDAAGKAFVGAKVPEDFAVTVPDPDQKDAYPIVSLTYVLLYQQPKDPAKAKAFNDFLKWAYSNGSQTATELGYVPLPQEISTKAAEALNNVKVANK